MVRDGRPPSAAGYREAAADLVRQYEEVAFEEVHRQLLGLFPTAPCRVLDVGAGTGRDAAALAALGHEVLAVEPTVELRVHTGLDWLDDSLPELGRVTGVFGLVLLTAVWMHLDGPERRRSMARLAGLLEPGGRMVLTLRHGPVPAGRRMFDVSAEETVALADAHGLGLLHRGSRGDGHGRAGVHWTELVFARPA
ncbi:class I SAM-dependent methyltransferase [Kitasatospora sp. NPDC059571]|uniref:class I SAM-dependent methyltransferase n=1 Tax=Kitasatospora sp. NPDC059571 TaxID=3346871 RepID=UPI0036B3F9AD